MAIFSCGTTNAHGWYVSGSNSWYVAFSSVLFAASQDRQLNESTNNNCWCDERVAF
jgi:hypothetical protein